MSILREKNKPAEWKLVLKGRTCCPQSLTQSTGRLLLVVERWAFSWDPKQEALLHVETSWDSMQVACVVAGNVMGWRWGLIWGETRRMSKCRVIRVRLEAVQPGKVAEKMKVERERNAEVAFCEDCAALRGAAWCNADPFGRGWAP